MPWFTLNRNYALSTTKGHSVNFKKNEKTWVPQSIVQEALALGAQPDDPIEKLLPPEPEGSEQLTAEQRKAKIFQVFEKLFLRQARGDFTASGLPSMKPLEAALGFEMPQQERDALWVEWYAKKGEQEEATRQ